MWTRQCEPSFKVSSDSRKLRVNNTSQFWHVNYLKVMVFLKNSQNSQENTYTGVSFLVKLKAFKRLLLQWWMKRTPRKPLRQLKSRYLPLLKAVFQPFHIIFSSRSRIRQITKTEAVVATGNYHDLTNFVWWIFSSSYYRMNFSLPFLEESLQLARWK